jgi:hypothetical protein
MKKKVNLTFMHHVKNVQVILEKCIKKHSFAIVKPEGGGK